MQRRNECNTVLGNFVAYWHSSAINELQLTLKWLIEHPLYVTNKESRKAATPTSPAFPRATPTLTSVLDTSNDKCKTWYPHTGLLTTDSVVKKTTRIAGPTDLRSSEPRILLGFLSYGIGRSVLNEWFPTSENKQKKTVVPSSSRVQIPRNTPWPSAIMALRFFEKSVIIHPMMPCHIPEDISLQNKSCRIW